MDDEKLLAFLQIGWNWVTEMMLWVVNQPGNQKKSAKLLTILNFDPF